MPPNWCMTSRFEAQPIATMLVAEGVAVLALPTSSVAWGMLLERFERRRNWIGNNLLDRLITYPELFFLSRTAFPVQNSNAYLKAVWISRFPASYAAGTLQTFLTNVARNSPTTTANLEMASLELQCFGWCSKNDRGKLCATLSGKVW